MAGYGKNSRGGKRGSSSSSSSSYVSMTTMLLVLACCVFAVYVLTSSSITHATPASNNVGHHHHKRNAVPLPPRTILRDPPPATDVHEDTQGDLPEDAVKGHHESISNMQEEVTSDSAGTEEDSRSEIEAVQHEKQQQEDVETNPEKPLHEEEVETRLRHDQSYDHGQQHVQEDQAHEQMEQQHEEINQNQAEEQQHDDAVNGQSNEEQQQEQQSSEENSEQHQQQHEQHGEEQSNTENQQQQQQQQSEANGEEGHRDETNNNESLQQSIDEMDNNHGKNQPEIIQQVTEESNTQSEEGEGISSQSQIEHDTDGTTEDHQQQEQQQEEEQQQQQQQEEEEHHQEQQQQEQQQQQQEEEEQQQEQQQQDSLQPQQTEDMSNVGGSNENNQPNEDNLNVNDSLPDGGQSTVPVENMGDKKTWATQADQSSNEKERRKGEGSSQSNEGNDGGNGDSGKSARQEWELCNVTAGPDYIPCLDNEKAIKQLRSFRHFEHRERHCPEESPTCLVPLPMGYKRSIQWPQSRDRIWYNNVPRTKLAEVKGHQNWVKVTGEYLTFPGGGTQFIHGALHYIDFIQQSVPEIAWGKHTRVILDVGCGVASFGGFLFERDVLAMSFAPKDEHEAQVQFGNFVAVSSKQTKKFNFLLNDEFQQYPQ